MICRVTAGDDYFYTRIAGQPLVSNIRASVTADGLAAAGWPWYSAPGSPAGSTSLDIEADLRAWVEEAYPELEDQLDGVDGQSFDGIKTTGETGEFRMQLLDEFLASRSKPTEPGTWVFAGSSSRAPGQNYVDDRGAASATDG